jgi:hypothetical protein
MIRACCLLFASTSFILGGAMMIDPTSTWAMLGLDVGPNPFVQALYGGAIMGEGAMFALGAIWPVRYLVFFQYLVIYKTFACIAGIAVLLRMEPAPTGAWLVIGAWASGCMGFGGFARGARLPLGTMAKHGALVLGSASNVGMAA